MRSLIGSKRFIKKHLDTLQKIILNIRRPQPGLMQCSLLSMLNDPLTVQSTPENINLESISIVGCCNGLVCLLLDSKHFMLWNPSTRKTNLLPDMDHEIERGCIYIYGFGFDELSGDYIVLGIATIARRSEAVCRVYSLETSSWKVVQGNLSPFFNLERVFSSGKMYWGRDGLDWDIVSFHLRSEVFDVVKLPVEDLDMNKSMGVVGGRLSLLYDDFARIDIWVMKESWEKVVSIPYVDTIPKTSRLSLLAKGPNGEILLTCGPCFEIFYIEDNGFRHRQLLDHILREAVLNAEILVDCVY